MAFDAEGTLHKLFDTVQVTDSFRKREFVLEMIDGAYTQLIKFQMVQDNCKKLDNLKEGQQVKATFNLRGREWTNPQGEVKYFNSLDCWRIEAAGNQTAVGTVQTAAMPEPQATGGNIPDPVSDDSLPF